VSAARSKMRTTKLPTPVPNACWLLSSRPSTSTATKHLHPSTQPAPNPGDAPWKSPATVAPSPRASLDCSPTPNAALAAHPHRMQHSQHAQAPQAPRKHRKHRASTAQAPRKHRASTAQAPLASSTAHAPLASSTAQAPLASSTAHGGIDRHRDRAREALAGTLQWCAAAAVAERTTRPASQPSLLMRSSSTARVPQ